MKKDAILQKLKTEKVIALIRADNPDGLLDCAKALAAGGLTSIELTMTTPGAIRMLEKATAELPDFLFGLGTVLDAAVGPRGYRMLAKIPRLPDQVIQNIAGSNKLTQEQFVQRLQQRIAGYKVPRTVVFHEQLPREDTGKIFKRKLREPYWEGRSRRV